VTHVALASVYCCTHHLNEPLVLKLGQDLDAPEVDESDGSVEAETVVAGMGIGVEQIGVPEGTRGEAMDDLRPRVLQVLVSVLGCGPIQFVQKRHCDDPITSCLLDDLWDAVERGPQ